MTDASLLPLIQTSPEMRHANVDALVHAWSLSGAPPPELTISEWSDAKRHLPSTSGVRGGRWRTERVPYLRGIMDAPHEPGVHTIAVKKCHQVGGSEALHNIVGYHIEHDPCPMLFVHPTSSVAVEWSKERLADMLRSTPSLRAVVREGRSARDGLDVESTLALKIFPGGFLALGGANTPNTFARRSVRLAIGDDVDRFPAVVGDEGDPADLLINRTTSFYDALAIFVSTPTLKGGRIDTLYDRSDRRQYVVVCPHCGREDWMTWSDANHFRVVFDDRNPETARLECPSPDHGGCGARLTEATRREMIVGGRWHATATESLDHVPADTRHLYVQVRQQEPGLVGFHLPAMVSTLGNVTLTTLVAKWLSARARGKESLRVFINTSLAEGWEDRSAKIEPHHLINRREDYGEGVEVPAPAVVLTAGVDVQVNRFEVQVIGWGPAGERWVVDWRTIPGDPKQPTTREALLDALGRRYAHASGHQLPILSTCVDTGWATEEMYDFVLTYQLRRIYATKGFAGRSGTPIVGKASDARYGKRPRPVRLYPVNVDDAKSDVIDGLSLPVAGPGYMHFPATVDTVEEEYFAQLCAEHKETRYNKAGVATHTVWVLDRERNEALDTAVLALAAFKLLNPNIRQMTETLAATPVPVVPTASTREQPPPQPPPMRRPVRSSYLGR